MKMSNSEFLVLLYFRTVYILDIVEGFRKTNQYESQVGDYVKRF